MTDEINSLVAELAEQLRQRTRHYGSGTAMVRIKQGCPSIDLFSWLHQQDFSQRAYWEDRDSDIKIAALGRSWSLRLTRKSDVRRAVTAAKGKTPPTGQCLSYLSFSDADTMIWDSFGYGEFFFPTLEVVQTRKGCWLACYLNPETQVSWRATITQALKTLLSVNWDDRFNSLAHASLAHGDARELHFSPDREHWGRIVSRALASLEASALSKVVLSREGQFTLKSDSNPWSLLQRWQQANPRSYVFAIESEHRQLFFGCSPERLFRRIDRSVQTEALAGTINRGQSCDEDAMLEQKLLTDAKNLHENRLVLDDIRRRMNPICASLEYDQTRSVVKLKTIQHLRYLIRAVLAPGYHDEDLILALHPTPAVGGSPRGAAIDFIEQNEGYSRGLYAGTFGLLSHSRTDFAVSIRSALQGDHTMSLFSGAGIVKGSDAIEEWSELDSKIKTVSELLRSSLKSSDNSCN